MTLILLDRDGVINEDTAEGITRPDQLVLIPGAAQAMAQLKTAGASLALVTNQSVVGKGWIDAMQLDAIHQHLCERLAAKGAVIDAIYWCGDSPDSPTDRRKPGAGMLREALAAFDADPAQTPMVGDALRDMQAACAAGCARHLVRTGKGRTTESDPALVSLQPVRIHDDLPAFATYWLRETAKLA